jgi:hypothetical protein
MIFSLNGGLKAGLKRFWPQKALAAEHAAIGLNQGRLLMMTTSAALLIRAIKAAQDEAVPSRLRARKAKPT